MDSLFAIDYSWLIPLLPLMGAAIAGLFGPRWLKQQSHWPIWIGVGGSALLSLSLLVGMIQRSHHGEVAPQEVRYPYVKLSNLPAESQAQSDAERERIAKARQASVYRMAASVDWYTWIEAGAFKATAGFFFDPLTAVMLCVVTGIGFWITVFAAGYMKGEAGYFRFFAYLGLFIFAMTALVMGNNFLMLYLGWEGVGLCSYLLIGYYYEKPAAREAAKKAFLVNRVGDFGFGLGIMLIYVIFGTVSFFGGGAGTQTGVLELAASSNIISAMEPWKRNAIPWIPFLLMIGAFGKSAQFPLHVWLPDAMEGPTPVSALIHAATMVTAGVYMIVRCGTLFVPHTAAMYTVAAIGTFTALYAALIALRQFDLKKVFAYSTISQLGFMFAAVGLWSPVPGIFHLMTHAFFKALLFLSSGVVMHAMLGHLDMRRMSGLKQVLPKTRWLMLIGCLALAGVPLLAGFFSKDEIIASAWYYNKFIALLLLIGAFLTAYYTFKLYFRVFEGPLLAPDTPAEGHAHHDDHQAHASGDTHESGVDAHLQTPAHDAATHHDHEPGIMIWPLVILAIGAVLAGYINYKHKLGKFLGHSPSLHLAHDVAVIKYKATTLDPVPFGTEELDPVVKKQMDEMHRIVMLLSIIASSMGIYFAYLFHLKYRDRSEDLANRFPALARAVEAKFWADEIYRAGIVEPLRGAGRFFFWVDRVVVDGMVWLVGFAPNLFGFTVKLTTQRGSLQGYAVTMLLAVVVILLVLFL